MGGFELRVHQLAVGEHASVDLGHHREIRCRIHRAEITDRQAEFRQVLHGIRRYRDDEQQAVLMTGGEDGPSQTQRVPGLLGGGRAVRGFCWRRKEDQLDTISRPRRIGQRLEMLP